MKRKPVRRRGRSNAPRVASRRKAVNTPLHSRPQPSAQGSRSIAHQPAKSGSHDDMSSRSIPANGASPSSAPGFRSFSALLEATAQFMVATNRDVQFFWTADAARRYASKQSDKNPGQPIITVDRSNLEDGAVAILGEWEWRLPVPGDKRGFFHAYFPRLPWWRRALNWFLNLVSL